MKWVWIPSILCLSLLLGGCVANWEVARASQQIEKTFDGLLGLSEEQVITAIGVPADIQEIGNLKVYKYRQSYGARSNAYASIYGSSTFGNANTWESYDDAQIIFKDGCAISWKGYVQR